MNETSHSALIGYSGFVGSTLLRQQQFTHLYSSANSHEMRERAFSSVICAGISAVKWVANQNPEQDKAAIDALLDNLATLRADHFTLISTIDVYPTPVRVTEQDDPHGHPNHAYGSHRLYAEDFVRSHFPNHLILRLPGLFGQGLKKNILFDLLNHRMLDSIQPKARFQWYDMSRLTQDCDIARKAGLSLLNLAVEPVETAEILSHFAPDFVVAAPSDLAPVYDMQTLHAGLFGGSGGYIQNKQQCLSAIGQFLATEAKTIPSNAA